MPTSIRHILVPAYLIDRLQPMLAAATPETETRLIGFESDGRVAGEPGAAEALFRYFPNDRFSGRDFRAAELLAIWDRAPRLRWVQTNASGVDSLLSPRFVASDIVLTSGASVNAGPVAESVLALLLAVARRIPQHVRHQAAREWQRYQKAELRGSTVVIVGWGKIGMEVGRLCGAFGMRVVVVRRHPATPTEGAAAVYGPADLPRALHEAGADYVVLVAASGPTDPPLLGATEIAALKPTAWLINVARGSQVDEPALIDALQSGRLGGAALDVFATEPLPPTSPLWDLPNVLLTPHNSASSPHQDQRTLDLFVDNYRRWIGGEPLLNVVDKARGY